MASNSPSVIIKDWLFEMSSGSIKLYPKNPHLFILDGSNFKYFLFFLNAGLILILNNFPSLSNKGKKIEGREIKISFY